MHNIQREIFGIADSCQAVYLIRKESVARTLNAHLKWSTRARASR